MKEGREASPGPADLGGYLGKGGVRAGVQLLWSILRADSEGHIVTLEPPAPEPTDQLDPFDAHQNDECGPQARACQIIVGGWSRQARVTGYRRDAPMRQPCAVQASLEIMSCCACGAARNGVTTLLPTMHDNGLHP